MRNNWIPLTETAHHDIAVCLIRNGQLEEGLEYVADMERECNVKSWLYDMLLYALLQRDELDEALRLLQHRVRTGFGGDITPNAWYGLFDAACARLHHTAIAFIWTRQVFANKERVKPSAGHCLAVMRAAARHGDVDLAEAAIKLLNDRGVVLGTTHYELLMDAQLVRADAVTRSPPPTTRFTPSADRKASPQAEAARESMRILDRAVRVLGAMATAGLNVQRASTRTLLSTLQADPRRIDAAHRTLASMKKAGTDVPTAAVDTLIEAAVHYAALSAPVDAGAARDWLRKAVDLYKGLGALCAAGPGIHTFNILLGGCADVGGEKATAMFLAAEMVARGMRPNAVTYDRLVLVCLRGADGHGVAGATGDAVSTGGGEPAVNTEGEAAAPAEKVAEDGEKETAAPETPTDQYAYEDAFRYLAEMTQNQWVPRAGTLRELIEACAKAGDPRAWELLGKMKEAGFDAGEVEGWLRERWEEV